MADQKRIEQLERALRELSAASEDLLAELQRIDAIADEHERCRALRELLRVRLMLVPK